MKKVKFFIIVLEFLISFFNHFLYEIYPSTLFSIFFPVNESIFEHMKMIASGILLISLIEYIIYKFKNIKYNNFLLSMFLQMTLGIVFYLIIFVPIYLLFGENLFFSISLLLITFLFTNYISYYILNYKSLKLNKISIFFIILLYIMFGYLTYNPIHNFLFIDPITEVYGIK